MDDATLEEEETVGLLIADEADGVPAETAHEAVANVPANNGGNRSDDEALSSRLVAPTMRPSRQRLLLILAAIFWCLLGEKTVHEKSDLVVDHHHSDDNSSSEELMTSANVSAVIQKKDTKEANSNPRDYMVVPLALLHVAKFAASVNNSYCGRNHEQPTSISQVAAHFGLLESYLLPEERDSADSDGDNSSTSSALVRTIAVPFHAYDSNGIKRTLGGDEFLVTVSGRCSTMNDGDDNNNNNNNNNNSRAWKTTAVARDASRGMYVAHLEIPALRNSVLHRVTMMHYYTCYQGFTRTPRDRAHRDYHQIDLGPVPVEPSPTFSELVRSVAASANPPFELDFTSHNPQNGLMVMQSLPECPHSQLGMDQLSRGIWVFPSLDHVENCTGEAKWVPSVCRPPAVAGGHLLRLDSKTTFQLFRVGDSTMPPAGGNMGNKWNIGDPFSADYRNSGLLFHDVYIDILKNRLPESEATDVLVLGHGLHQILRGKFNVQTVVDSVLRMLCQMAIVFPGRLVVQAPVPIQQQLFYKFDQTDTNVNMFKAILRERMSAVDARLADLCQDAELDVFYSASSSTGDFASLDETLRLFEKVHQYSPALNASKDEQELTRYFRGLSAQERRSIWGDRRVIYANVAHLLRPRPECYRDNDKIHALRGVQGHGYMMDFGHGELIKHIAAQRARMGP